MKGRLEDDFFIMKFFVLRMGGNQSKIGYFGKQMRKEISLDQ